MLKTIIDNDTFFKVVKAELGSKKNVSFTVKGTSMWPFYKDGKTIVFVVLPERLKKYDVVLANYQGKVILHRIIKIQNNTYTLRGDATYRKEVVDVKDIFAKVTIHQNQKKVSIHSKKYRLSVFLWVNNPFRTLLLRLRSLK
jgi:signal peptidase I